MGERLVRNEEVSGSIPLSSTTAVSRFQQEIKQTRPFSSLREEALLSLARTSALLMHDWEQALKGHGITPTQYNVLRILRGAGPEGLCRYEIAERLIAPVPDVSRLLDRMEASGLLRRHRALEDRRLVVTIITREGLELLTELDEPGRKIIDSQMPTMTDEQLRTLLELLERARTGLNAAARRADTEAKPQVASPGE